MFIILAFAFGAALGWAVGSGNIKAVWAALVAAAAAVTTFLDPIIETVKGWL